MAITSAAALRTFQEMTTLLCIVVRYPDDQKYPTCYGSAQHNHLDFEILQAVNSFL